MKPAKILRFREVLLLRYTRDSGAGVPASNVEVKLIGEGMPVPISQAWTVASYVLKQKIKGRKQYPLVLMLEPLYRCNLACAGCGKIQYPAHVLKRELSPEECFQGCR